ncbi:MAG: hypothetical protein ACLT76_11815 [Clostridium fessum]
MYAAYSGFADSMIIGMRSLTYSASFFEDDEDARAGKDSNSF